MNLVDAVHGQRMRHHLKEGSGRIEIHRQKPRLHRVRQATLALERAEIKRYEVVVKYIEDYRCDTWYVSGGMTMHFLQWSARRVYASDEEAQALISGRDAC